MKPTSSTGKTSLFTKWILLLLAIFSGYAAVLGTISFFDIPKIGYVDSSILLEKYQGAIDAREKIKKQTDEWQDNINTLESELGKLNKEIVEENNAWNKEMRKLKQEAFLKKQNELVRYSRAVNDKAVKLERELTGPVFNTINAYISDFGKIYGYDMIFGTVAGGNILYAKEPVNLTNEFLAYMNGKE